MFRYFYYDITLAIRLAVLAVSIVLGVIVLVTGASIANAATLKSDVLLNAPVLTAGDLFDGLEKDKAAKVLGPAPMPGQDMVLNTLTLMQVAAALSIDWKPQSTGEQVVVRSATTLVEEKTITDALTKKLQEKGVTGEFSLDYFNVPKLVLPKDVPATAEVASISYHPESGRFEATLIGPDAAHQAGTTQVSGHVEHTVSVPVLKKALRNGDLIRAEVEALAGGEVDGTPASRRRRSPGESEPHPRRRFACIDVDDEQWLTLRTAALDAGLTVGRYVGEIVESAAYAAGWRASSEARE